MNKIIDTHCHVFPDKVAQRAAHGICDFYGFPYTSCQTGTYSQLVNESLAVGVTHFVVCSTATKPEQVEHVNDWISSLADDSTIPLGTLHPDYKEKRKEVDRMISLGLRGVKLHNDIQQFKVDSKQAYEIFELIEGRLPVLLHAGDKRYDFSSPRQIAKVLDRFPKLDVIASHLGGFSEWENSMKYLVGRRIWFDTSSSVRFLPVDTAMKIIEAHGADKVMYGTDYPIVNIPDELNMIKSLPLSPDELEKILFGTASKFYGIE